MKTVAEEEEEGRTRRSGSRDVSFMSSAAPRLSSSPETAKSKTIKMKKKKEEEEEEEKRTEKLK